MRFIQDMTLIKHNYLKPLTCLQEKYQRAVQKIQLLKKERTELQQELGLKDEEILG